MEILPPYAPPYMHALTCMYKTAALLHSDFFVGCLDYYFCYGAGEVNGLWKSVTTSTELVYFITIWGLLWSISSSVKNGEVEANRTKFRQINNCSFIITIQPGIEW